MYYLQEFSVNRDHPVYQKLDSTNTFLFPERQIAFDFATRGVYERALIDWACDNFSEKDFIDIGAHVGTYALPFGQKTNVHAFECSPRTYNFLCGNIALRNLDYKIKTYNVALGDTEGTSTYYIRSTDGGGNGCMEFEDETSTKITVPMRTLDSYNFSNIGLIKIDVEGYEKKVLQGAVDTIRRNNPKILFESWEPTTPERHALQTELFEYISCLGYTILKVGGSIDMYLAEKPN